MFSLLNTFRVIALLEGISYILLLFIAVPIKYFANDPQYVKMLGMPHGILFVAYVILAIILGSKLKWKTSSLLFILAASVIPFGTFYVDKVYLKQVS
ncbi:DUF3817 domain-containing protein [Xanthomarina sp. F2636L]|uniref:DUF3817 domain-containing protein n=1 Tax=Xanthomarina sp. F2636L TaxID=2996018 RepID=UPI00225E04C0|nr:DUF3817 domain-containing protein [Xanthomarina sp. F2636L]MCX7549554.1 DUF3817 domain-containing protein [Xanthomarina sp. F2636L]